MCLASVGLGISVVPHFEQVERFRGIVWRTLTKPRLWTDFGLVWRRQGASPVVSQFVAMAEKMLPLPQEVDRAQQ